MWAGWDAYITAFRDVLGLRLPEHEKYAPWEACATEGGFRFMHAKFCLVSDRPEILETDERHRPHSDVGPSHRWRDGWSLYHIHGVRVPAHVVLAPQTITVIEIEAEKNSEVRRVMIDRYGPARFVKDSGAQVVHSLPADFAMVGLRDAKLLRKEVPNDEAIVYVDLLNSTPEPDGTTKRYMLRVDPNAYDGLASRDCLAAAASTWRNRDGSLVFKAPTDYHPVFES